MRRNFCDDRPCEDGLQCLTTEDSPYFKCDSCPLGSSSQDGVNCVDVDECRLVEPCDSLTQCINLSPGFRCEKCPVGYRGQYTEKSFVPSINNYIEHFQCIDVDECREGIASCGLKSQCVNRDGSYNCVCMTGHTRSNNSSDCIAVAGMCADGVTICDRNANCRSLGARRFGCQCKVGFAGDGFYCGGDKDLDGWPDRDLGCPSPLCRQDNCPSIPVRRIKQFKLSTSNLTVDYRIQVRKIKIKMASAMFAILISIMTEFSTAT